MMSEQQFDQIKEEPYAILTYMDSRSYHGDKRYSHFECEIRNPAGKNQWLSVNAGELRVTCQMDSDHPETYAWEYRYAKHGGLTLDDMERGMPVMKKVYKGLTKRSQEQGNPRDFAEYALEIMRTLKVKVVFVNVDHADGTPIDSKCVFELRHFNLPKEGGGFLSLVRWAEQNRANRPKAA